MAVLFFFVFGVLLLNMASAGAAALLAIKAGGAGWVRRTVWSSAATGLVALLAFFGIVLTDQREMFDSAGLASAVLALVTVCFSLLSVPGALVMSRMAQRPPPVGDTFA